jgi:hypothetical protein
MTNVKTQQFFKSDVDALEAEAKFAEYKERQTPEHLVEDQEFFKEKALWLRDLAERISRVIADG